MAKETFTVYVDDFDIDFFGMKLLNYEIRSYAKRKVVGTSIPGAHGTEEVPWTLDSMPFVVNVICEGKSTDDVNSKIREFFAFMHSTSSPHKIIFSDDAEVIRYAILDSPGNHRVVGGVDNAFAQLKLTFYMLDPFVYSDTRSIVAATVAHGEHLVVYNDAFECPAIYKLTNVGSSVVNGVSIIVNDELSSFSCPLNPGDVLELDTEEYEVRLNGVVNIDYWRGEMPLLRNGVNEVYQQNSSRDSLELSVTFTRKWA